MKSSTKLFVGMLFLFITPLMLVSLIHYSRTVITPNDQFFIVQKGETPSIDKDNWTLEITGKIKHEIRFDYSNYINHSCI